MTVWNKLVTALRGAAHEAGEAVTDSQALRILDQEIRDADNDLNKSKEALAEIMAKQKLASTQLQNTQAKISEYEGYALKALETNDENIMLRIDKDNTVWVNDSEAPTRQEVIAKLREAREDGSSTLIVMASGDCRHETVVMALDAGAAAGIDDVRLSNIGADDL